MQNNVIICPTCSSECYIGLDEYGRTPFHLHCEKCNINIGATSIKKCIELLQKYHKPKTWIEFYCNEIKVLNENGKFIIMREPGQRNINLDYRIKRLR